MFSPALVCLLAGLRKTTRPIFKKIRLELAHVAMYQMVVRGRLHGPRKKPINFDADIHLFIYDQGPLTSQ